MFTKAVREGDVMDKNELDIAEVVSRLMSDPGVTEAVKKLSGGSAGVSPAHETGPSVTETERSGINGELAAKLPEMMKLLKPMLYSAEKGKGESTEADKRNRLLAALKPYLSDSRREVIDRVISLPDLGSLSELMSKLKP